ncbi:SNF2-related protein [Prevotellamassilia timonensis]|uniref:SNF2-related protein n=1 Tax=Prevotellamassilia timonensis TaxID=1852370 RepID=UPI001F3CFD62|nr:SNF2-related protein [Prevotellamassilia timonensis]
MATKYGKTWWGEQWLGALKNIDYSNRLPRGASYARNGMVQEIKFLGNIISAKVKGSRRTPYSETIKLPEFSSKDIDKLIKLILEQPVVLSKLFNRQLDESLAKMAEEAGMPLFPKQWKDLKMSCSCPDWAVPCKHLDAVIYKTSMEIDNNPFLVFSLHGVDLMAELEKRGITAADSTEMMEVENTSAVYATMEQMQLRKVPELMPDYTLLSDLALPLSSLLPSSPAFCHNGDFQQAYQRELLYISKVATKVLQDKQKLFEATGGKTLNKREVVSVDDVCPPLLQQLLDINIDFLRDYDDSIVALRSVLICALQLIAHGCVVPQIYYDLVISKGRGRAKAKEEKEYHIIWQPAMIDEATRSIIGRLGQNKELVSKMVTSVVPMLSHESKDELFYGLFFKAECSRFNGIGETNTPGGIRSWLDRYFMQNKHQVTFFIDETDKGFAVNVEADDHPLEDVMTKKAYSSSRMEILRQLAILCDIVDGLDAYINDKGKRSIEFTMQTFPTFLLQVIPAMRLLGVSVIMPKALQTLIHPQISVKLKSKGRDSNGFLSMGDLLDFNWQVAVGNVFLSPEQFDRLLGHASGLLRFKEQYVYVDEAGMSKLQKVLNAPPKIKPGELLQAALCGEYKGAPVELTDEVRELIRQFTSQSVIPLPENINAKLRPYQERGFSWMYRNMKIGFGSIIADDMGLGKTLQVITLLAKMKEEGAMDKKKALVVVPTGLLHNWQAEVKRFAPGLTTGVYHGTARDLKDVVCKNADIILSTYGVVRSDADILKKQKWQVLVIDEAQNIKNSDAAQSKAIRSIPANCYIAMSGTPVENRLSEFWSIIDFTNKGYLGSAKDFSDSYAKPIQKYGDSHVAERFRKVTAPFLMRRLKTDKSIISDLPDKIERNELASLTPEQAALYQETVNKCMAVIESMEGEDSQALFKRQGLILQMMLALKQICNHPTQYLKDNRMDATLSGKTEMLLDMLRSIIDADEKVLIFTQFREMGDLLRHFIRTTLDEEPMFYHGGCSLKQRQEMVDRFQNNRNDRIFILSLKAAGTGLNLTAATHVIHYDLWWNPAVEAQATDRAYRIGQHKNVQVHRFITQNTFEERIDAMIQEKKHLADLTVSTGESWIGKLSNKELHEIFG